MRVDTLSDWTLAPAGVPSVVYVALGRWTDKMARSADNGTATVIE